MSLPIHKFWCTGAGTLLAGFNSNGTMDTTRLRDFLTSILERAEDRDVVLPGASAFIAARRLNLPPDRAIVLRLAELYVAHLSPLWRSAASSELATGRRGRPVRVDLCAPSHLTNMHRPPTRLQRTGTSRGRRRFEASLRTRRRAGGTARPLPRPWWECSRRT